MARNDLMGLADQYFSRQMTPNASDLAQAPDEPTAALSGFLMQVGHSGGDLDSWSEEQWEQVLSEKFGIGEDYMADALEQVASWGVVDNDWYEPEEGE
jgi:uncharacterized tellurite resistance protein B-like protein